MPMCLGFLQIWTADPSFPQCYGMINRRRERGANCTWQRRAATNRPPIPEVKTSSFLVWGYFARCGTLVMSPERVA